MGGAVARVFARKGANVFLTGRTLDKLAAVAKEISTGSGTVEATQVDALDEWGVEKHLNDIFHKTGRLDISFNAMGIPASIVREKGMQGVPLTDVSLDSFIEPITTYTRSHFVTARAPARQMARKGSGTILMHTPEPGRRGTPLIGGMGPAWTAMEAICRGFSAELGFRETLEGFDFGKLLKRSEGEEKKSYSKAELVQLLRTSGENWAQWVEGLPEQILAEQVGQPGGSSKTRFEMILGTKEHEMHHRAQLTVIERLLGIVPHLTRNRQAARSEPTKRAS